MSPAGRLPAGPGLWVLTGAVVLSAHLALALWVGTQVRGSALPALPDAIRVELVAAAPPAPSASAPETTPDTSPLPEAPPPQVFSTPDLAPPPPPVPPPPEAEPPAALAPALPALSPLPPPDLSAPVASPRPVARPLRPRAASPAAQPAGHSTPARAAPANPPPPQASAPRSGGAASGTARAARPAVSAQAMANWQARVQTTIARHMNRTRLPGRSRGDLRVRIRIAVGADGRASAALAGSTGDTRIDAALQRQAQRLPRLPAPPGGKPVTLTQPVRIQSR